MVPARARRPACSALGLCLVALLVTLAVVEAPESSLRILTRYTVLSFDDPGGQILDEIACESSGPIGRALTALPITRLPVSRLPVSAPSVVFDDPALSSCVTRSPPAA
jgi:hypothetical protein